MVQIELLRAAAEQRGIELEEATVTNLTDLQSAVVSMSKKVDGFVFPTDNVCGRRHGGRFAHDGAGSSVTVSGDMGSLAAGCTAAMTVDYYKLGLQAAQLGADILEGRTTAAETPIGVQDVKNPTFNETAMKRLGLEIPEDLKAGALLWQKNERRSRVLITMPQRESCGFFYFSVAALGRARLSQPVDQDLREV